MLFYFFIPNFAPTLYIFSSLESDFLALVFPSLPALAHPLSPTLAPLSKIYLSSISSDTSLLHSHQFLSFSHMRDTLKKLRLALRPIYGNRETEAIIKIIFHYLKGWNTVDLIIHEPDSLSPFLKGEIDKILTRLLNHEPIQYITGEARFHGLDFKVSPDVLIPRPETEELVDIIVDDCRGQKDLQVLDIGTGSGCIAISLARGMDFPVISALDISSEALSVAKENAKILAVNVNFLQADIFNWSPEKKFDIIVSNPPYIDESEKKDMEDNVLLHEPHSALFVPDADPLIFYRRIASIGATSLNSGGRLYFEINPRHASELADLLSGYGFSQICILKDSYAKDRFISATFNPS